LTASTRILALALAGLAWYPTASRAQTLDQAAATQLLEDGIVLLESGDIEAATLAFRRVVQDQPSPKARFFLGKSLALVGDCRGAFAELDDYIKSTKVGGLRANADRIRRSCLVDKGLRAEAEGRGTDAEVAYREALADDAGNLMAGALLGQLLLSVGRCGDALGYLGGGVSCAGAAAPTPSPTPSLSPSAPPAGKPVGANRGGAFVEASFSGALNVTLGGYARTWALRAELSGEFRGIGSDFEMGSALAVHWEPMWRRKVGVSPGLGSSLVWDVGQGGNDGRSLSGWVDVRVPITFASTRRLDDVVGRLMPGLRVRLVHREDHADGPTPETATLSFVVDAVLGIELGTSGRVRR